MNSQTKLSNTGFSMVELIVVIAIMAVLVGLLAPTMIGNIEKARESTDLQNLDSIRQAVVNAMAEEDIYKETTGAVSTGSSYATYVVFGTNVSGAAITVNSGFPKLSSKFQEIMNSGVLKPLSSSAGKSGNLEVRIFADGKIEVGVYASASSTTPVYATKSKKYMVVK